MRARCTVAKCPFRKDQCKLKKSLEKWRCSKRIVKLIIQTHYSDLSSYGATKGEVAEFYS